LLDLSKLGIWNSFSKEKEGKWRHHREDLDDRANQKGI
jgi:hypothetical protein